MKKFLKILFLIPLLVLWISCEYEKPDRAHLNKNGKFTIGLYLGRTVVDSITESVFYEYEVAGDTFQKFDMECYLDSEKAKDHFYFKNYPLLRGNLFVVLYDSLKPEISIIRLDYPLRDSIDYESSIRKINKNRKIEADSLKS
jgi:hypothetical protein